MERQTATSHLPPRSSTLSLLCSVRQSTPAVRFRFLVAFLWGFLAAGSFLPSLTSAQEMHPTAEVETRAGRSLGERTTLWLIERGLGPEIVVVAISMLPVVELRGAMPTGLFFLRPGLPFWKVLGLSVIGNIAPIPLLLLVLGYLVRVLQRLPVLRGVVSWFLARTERRASAVQKSAFWGLVFFVGIPLPGTGAWTGALVAWLMGLPYWRALSAIFVGVLVAGAAVGIPCILFQHNLTLGLTITGGILGVMLLLQILRVMRRVRGRQPEGHRPVDREPQKG